MKRIIAMCVTAVLLATMASACGNTHEAADIATGQDISDNAVGGESVPNGTNSASVNEVAALTVPQELEAIPEEYYSPGAQQGTQQGTLVELTYDTYESKTYSQKTQQLQKQAIRYLPYGYNEAQKYNVFYLMHGG